MTTPRPNSVEYLIVEGLGYCCEKFFWQLYFDVDSDLIAARLGVDYEAIRRHKKRFHAGGYACQKKDCCIPKRLEKSCDPETT